MAHEFGVTPKFLSLTPTRDNIAAPGGRMPDKHTRLFCGKTLDEWMMLQLWSSKHLGKAVFICETEQHKDRLYEMAYKYGVTLLVRPRQMLSPVCDSGAIPVAWAAEQVNRAEYYSLVTTPLVVSPCLRPGFFDYMVDEYVRIFSLAPDRERGEMWIMGAHDIDAIMWRVDKNNNGRQMGEDYMNHEDGMMLSKGQHWIGSYHWWRAYCYLRDSRHDIGFKPRIFQVEPWEEQHIDTEEDWEIAEYYFQTKILSQGEDCYEKYRASWKDGATGGAGSSLRG